MWTPWKKIEEDIEMFQKEAAYTQPHIETYLKYQPESLHLRDLQDQRKACLLAVKALNAALGEFWALQRTQERATDE